MASARLRHIARSAQSGLLDTFLVAAVLAVLTIRVYLKAANYPQIGGGGLHVAHVLWGGLGMVIAIVLLLAFLGSATQRLAAIVGGIGFGAFVDELGKFVTADNNYFFKPTAALIYTIFVVLILATREIRRIRKLSPEENLVNAIEISKAMAMGSLTRPQRDRALDLLASADQERPLVAQLKGEFLGAECIDSRPSRFVAVASAGERRYLALVSTKWFRRGIAALFILLALAVVLSTILVLAVAVAVLAGFITAQEATQAVGRIDLGSIVEAGAALIACGTTIAGILALRRSRIRAYRCFEISVLIDLLLAQPFTLLDAGFAGLVEVFIDLALLVTLRFMIAQEQRLVARAAGVPTAASARS
jgi:hypothetical protein